METPGSVLTGRTRTNLIVNFPGRGGDGGDGLIGRTAAVRITEALPHSLRGRLVEAPAPARAPAVDGAEGGVLACNVS